MNKPVESALRQAQARDELQSLSEGTSDGILNDDTEKNRTMALLRASEQRYRLIADNVSDIIWTSSIHLSDSEKALAKVDAATVVGAVLERWRFSYVSSAAKRIFGYTFGYNSHDIKRLSLREIVTPATYEQIRSRMTDVLWLPSPESNGNHPRPPFDAEILDKDRSVRWCEIVSTYLRDKEGFPTGILGITRDISGRRRAERALRESESKLRSLFEHLPDLLVTLDRKAMIHFANRGLPDVDREQLIGACVLSFVVPEHQQHCRRVIEQAFATGQPQSLETRDIFGSWWSCRLVPLAQEGDKEHILVIGTDVTQQRLAAEAVDKEQQLLRRLLDLHERERRLTAYDIHDGFAQQLTGAMYRLQGFRGMLDRNPEKAWDDFNSAMRLIGRGIDETRRLVSGLRPPILDESGVIDAIDYLVCEQGHQMGPTIEFVHNVAFDRLAPPLESALFRITQESLQNACRHSRSVKVRIELTQRGSRIHLGIRDWGVGFSPDHVEQQHFGLQGIRERTRLLDGSVTIESVPGQGTHIAVELPLVDCNGDTAVDP